MEQVTKKRTNLEKNYFIEVTDEEIKHLRENETPLRFMSMMHNGVTGREIHVRLVTMDDETSYLISAGMEGSLEVCERDVKTKTLSFREFNKIIKEKIPLRLSTISLANKTKHIRLRRFKPSLASYYIIVRRGELSFTKEDNMHKDYRTIGMPLPKDRQQGDKMSEFKRRVHEYIRIITDGKQPEPELIKWLQDEMGKRGNEGIDYYFKNLPVIKLKGEARTAVKKSLPRSRTSII